MQTITHLLCRCVLSVYMYVSHWWALIGTTFPLLQLMHNAEELHHARQVQKNIIDTIETLNLCIPVLQHYCKLNEQMEQRQYYSALKTLEQLEHTFLPRVRGYVATSPSSHPTSIERKDLVSYSQNIGQE